MKASKKIVFMILGGVVFIVFLLFSCSFFHLFSSSGNFFQELKEYQLIKFDPATNYTSEEIVRISTNLEEGEFLTYKDENSRFFVISKFSEENVKYECYGRCFCDSKRVSDRRNLGVLSLTKGIFVVISAISTYVAIRIAETYFHEECVSKLQSSCESRNIKAEVDRCLKVVVFENKRINVEMKKSGIRKYYCNGHCVIKRGFKRDEPKNAAEKFKCKSHDISGMVKVNVNEINPKYDPHIKAMNVFRTKYLSPFCNCISVFEYSYYYAKPNGGFERRDQTVILCTSRSGYKSYNNIKCTIFLGKFQKDFPSKVLERGW